MKTTKWLVGLIVVGIVMICSAARAQGTFAFNWTENKGDNTGDVLTTPSVTNLQSPSTALGYVTSYHSEFTLNNDSLSVYRPSINYSYLGASATYIAGPLAISAAGTTIDFSAWLNPSAQAGSSESIYDILVNNIPLSETVTADQSTPFDQFQYVSSIPITDIQFDYVINAVSDTSETGIGLNMLSIAVTPEPNTTAMILVGFGAMSLLVMQRKRCSR